MVADFNPNSSTHAMTNAALGHLGALWEWVPTESIEEDSELHLAGFDGLWIGPGSPYRSMRGALAAIRHAREREVPLVGT